MNYSKVINKQDFDAIVIGAGMAGLSCAANLSASGLSVLVLEQHFIPGGATTMFKRGDFVFEGGGHRVTGIRTPGAPLYELIKKIGKDKVINPIPINPSYVVKVGDKRLEADININKYKENLIDLFPDQELNIHRFIEDMLKMNEALTYVASNKVNPFVLLTKYGLFIKYAKKTTGDFIYNYFRDDEIITFVTAVGNYTTLPIKKQSFLNFANMWSAHHLGEGMSLIEGGTIVLVDALVEFIEQHRGQVVVSKDVVEIVIEDHKAVGVRIKDGTEIRAKSIISTVSNHETYLKLIAPPASKGILSEYD